MKYRKKPVIVDAVQWTGDNYDEIKRFAGENVTMDGTDLIVKTLEDGKDNKAKHVATVGDYIIRGVEGEYYFCKPHVFVKTYEAVDVFEKTSMQP